MASGFNFDHPALNWNAADIYQEFERFKQHVSFVFKGPLSKSEKKDRAGWLGLWIGQQGREIYKTFEWNDGEQDDPDVILNKLQTYVRPRKNKRIARFRASQRKQSEGETFDNFVKDLRILLMDCDYDNSDDILTDLIINGVSHPKVQERMLDKGSDLTLAKALEIGQQFELSQQQLKLIRNEEVVNKIGTKAPKKVKTQLQFKQRATSSSSESKDIKSKCPNCGTSHIKGKCPAKGTFCKYCKKPDHWLSVCRKRLRRVNFVDEEEQEMSDSDSEELLYIQTIDIASVNLVQESKWTIHLNIGGKMVKFCIDTGAKCNIIVNSKFQTLQSGITLEKSNKTLKSFTNHEIVPIGKITVPVKLSADSPEILATFQVIDLDQESVISGELAEKLGLIKRILTVSDFSMETDQELTHDFPELVKTTGTLPGEYEIKTEENAKGVIHPPRRIPAAIREKAIKELKDMEASGYITPVDEPTEWVNSMVVSVRNEKVRICLDPKDLNKVVKREHYPMKTIDDVTQHIPDATVFSVLDAKSGFMQIKLDQKSSYLTTMNTPLGRFRWLRLPYGIRSAPEIYQRIMDQMISGIDGAFAIIDDILIAGRSMEHHDQILRQVVERATSYNLKLNFSKCLIRQSRVKYMGHILSPEGLLPDPAKVSAVLEMPAPSDKEGVRRFLGLVQYLAKFIPNLSEIDAPLRVLLKSDVPFIWEFEQEQSFQELKKLCSSPPVLAYYDVNKSVEIECDSSKDGLGAVLLQEGHVIAYASQSLTETEKRYAQIEKEMLSVKFSVNKFHNYIFGKDTTVYNDHKPLSQIFTKPLLSAPMRIQKMLLQLQWYNLKIIYRKGTEMKISDALSRAYLPLEQSDNHDVENVTDLISMISVSKDKYATIQELTKVELGVLYEIIVNGWPDVKGEVSIEARQYWDSRDQLSILDGIIYKGLRIVIPPSLRAEMLKLIHKSHLGMTKCKQRAREVMYWPSMNADLESVVSECYQCASVLNNQSAEPLNPTTPPDLPYSMVGSDLFDFEAKKYLLLVDYYSKYIDVVHLESSVTASVTEAMKSVFATHGIPQKLRTDNGPQFASQEFRTFCREIGIEHETSSPHFQSSNGEAERAIQTVKSLWKKSPDKTLALLDYRTTPLEGLKRSPAQLLMGRRPRNMLPAATGVLAPKTEDSHVVKQFLQQDKQKQKFYYDKRKGVKSLPTLEPETPVMIKHGNSKTWASGTVIQKHDKPRSYVVASENRLYRRNRKHLRKTNAIAKPQLSYDFLDEPQDDTPSENVQLSERKSSPAKKGPVSETLQSDQYKKTYMTKSGRTVKPPTKLDL